MASMSERRSPGPAAPDLRIAGTRLAVHRSAVSAAAGSRSTTVIAEGVTLSPSCRTSAKPSPIAAAKVRASPHEMPAFRWCARYASTITGTTNAACVRSQLCMSGCTTLAMPAAVKVCAQSASVTVVKSGPPRHDFRRQFAAVHARQDRRKAEGEALRAHRIAQASERLERVEHEHHLPRGAHPQRWQKHVPPARLAPSPAKAPRRRLVEHCGDANCRPLTVAGDYRLIALQLLQPLAARDGRYIVSGARQLKCERAADATKTYHRDLHGSRIVRAARVNKARASEHG